MPALAYRQWMRETLRPPDRSMFPAWINDINVIIFHSNVEREILPQLSRLVDPEQTLIFLHQWRHNGHDGDLPNYAPDAVKPEFAAFVKEAHRYGFKVMVHVNMTGISEYHPLYAKFEKYQVRWPETGEKAGYKWDDLTHPGRHAKINLASSEYRKMFVDTLKSVWDRYSVDAFHFDLNHFILNDNNGLIDGLTMAEGYIRLHQELRAAIPSIVIGGEGINDVTFLYESFVQRGRISETEIPHPISSFVFSLYTKPYGYFIPTRIMHLTNTKNFSMNMKSGMFYLPFELLSQRIWKRKTDLKLLSYLNSRASGKTGHSETLTAMGSSTSSTSHSSHSILGKKSRAIDAQM